MNDPIPTGSRAGRNSYPAWPLNQWSFLSRVGLLVGLLVLVSGAGFQAVVAEDGSGLNFFEQRKIEAQALEAFQRVITLWKEEVYFELYDFGMEESRSRISREEFAQRMVELSWLPHGDLNPKFLSSTFRFRTVVYLKARVPYRHKFNPERRFSKDQTLVMVQENGDWRLDLIELIRAPYSGV